MMLPFLPMLLFLSNCLIMPLKLHLSGHHTSLGDPGNHHMVTTVHLVTTSKGWRLPLSLLLSALLREGQYGILIRVNSSVPSMKLSS